MSEQCTDLFGEVFDDHGGGCLRSCACGKTHFDTYNVWDWEEGELEELQAKADAEPDKYQGHDHAVGMMNIGDVYVVHGCTCDIAKRYETWIRANAEQLSLYLNKWADQLREKATKIGVNNG